MDFFKSKLTFLGYSIEIVNNDIQTGVISK